MKAVVSVIQEQVKYFRMIIQLGWFEIRTTYAGNTLGAAWIFLNPLLQIGVYWFAFGIGLKSGKPIDGVPYVYWLTVGLIAWFYLNQSISAGTSSIYKRIKVLSKMNFPLSVVPSFIVYAQFLEHFVLLIATLVLVGVGLGNLNLHVLQLPYYVFASTCLLVSVNLLLSALASVVRDVKILVSSFMKFGMFLTPVVWSPEHLPVIYQQILRLNPFFYLIEGYRESLLGNGVWFFEKLTYTLYFWIVVFVIFSIGAVANKRLRNHLLDYL